MGYWPAALHGVETAVQSSNCCRIDEEIWCQLPVTMLLNLYSQLAQTDLNIDLLAIAVNAQLNTENSFTVASNWVFGSFMWLTRFTSDVMPSSTQGNDAATETSAEAKDLLKRFEAAGQGMNVRPRYILAATWIRSYLCTRTCTLVRTQGHCERVIWRRGTSQSHLQPYILLVPLVPESKKV